MKRCIGIALVGVFVCGVLFAGTARQEFEAEWWADTSPDEPFDDTVIPDPNWRTFNTYVDILDGTGPSGESEIKFKGIQNEGTSDDSPSGVWGGVMYKQAIDLNLAGTTTLHWRIRFDDDIPFLPGSTTVYDAFCFGLAPRDDVYSEYDYSWKASNGQSYYTEQYYVGTPIDGISGGYYEGADSVQIGYPSNWDGDLTEWAKMSGGPGPFTIGYDQDNGQYQEFKVEFDWLETGLWEARIGYLDQDTLTWEWNIGSGSPPVEPYMFAHYEPDYTLSDAPDMYAYFFSGNGYWVESAGNYIAADWVEVSGPGVPDPTEPCVLTADFQGDGDVDIFDVGAFAAAYTGGLLTADFQGDGDVDIFDVGAYSAAYTAQEGQTCDTAAGAATVPEPTTLILVGSMLIAPFVRRRV